jgi:hypothetical protein
MLDILNRHGTLPAKAQASPNLPLTPSRLFPWSNNGVACRICCMRAVRTSASEAGAFPCQPNQSSDFFAVPLARKPLSHPMWRFRGCCGGTCGGRYARVRRVPPSTLAAGRSKSKKEPLGTPWAARPVTGWVPAALCRGYPLGHTDPSPAFALHREGWTALHFAAIHGHLPAVNALIHAGAPLEIQTNGLGWALLCNRSAGPNRRGPLPPPPAGGRRCSSLPSTAAPTQRPRCSAPARPSRAHTGNAVPHRITPIRFRPTAAGVLQDGRARSTKAREERRVRGGGGAGAHFRALFHHIFATASRAATALLLVRSCTRASTCRARRARPAAAVGTLVRVGCCAASTRTARADQPVSLSRARN